MKGKLVSKVLAKLKKAEKQVTVVVARQPGVAKKSLRISCTRNAKRFFVPPTGWLQRFAQSKARLAKVKNSRCSIELVKQ